MALMQRQGTDLPDQRVRLYHNYVEVMLKHWNEERSLSRESVGRRDLDLDATLDVLADLALRIQRPAPGAAVVNLEDTRAKLVEIYTARKEPKPKQAAERLLQAARGESSLWLELGRGQYGFIHLQFLEYLAGLAIAKRTQTESSCGRMTC